MDELIQSNNRMIELLTLIAQKELIVDKRSLVDVVDSSQGQRVNLNGRGLA